MASEQDILSARDLGAELFLRPRGRGLALPKSTSRTGVVGVGVGEKRVRGKSTGTPCVKLLVIAKRDEAALAAGALLPREIDGIPTDVEAVGVIEAFQAMAARSSVAASSRTRLSNVTLSPKSRWRPVRPGCSISAGERSTAGTLGALVRRGKQFYLLSNYHVLCSGPTSLVVVRGATVFQPSRLHDVTGGNDNKVATTIEANDSVLLSLDDPNLVDCALAQIEPGTLVEPEILQINRRPQSAIAARPGMVVEKMGCETGRTTGIVVAVGAKLDIMMEAGAVSFTNQIVIKSQPSRSRSQPSGPFANVGDSGALVVEVGTAAAVGLLCGGSTLGDARVSIASPIATVLSRLGVQLVS